MIIKTEGAPKSRPEVVFLTSFLKKTSLGLFIKLLILILQDYNLKLSLTCSLKCHLLPHCALLSRFLLHNLPLGFL